MRTTLDIADDVLQAAKERAHREKKTVGEVISELARSALTTAPQGLTVREPKAVYGFLTRETRMSSSIAARAIPSAGTASIAIGSQTVNR